MKFFTTLNFFSCTKWNFFTTLIFFFHVLNEIFAPPCSLNRYYRVGNSDVLYAKYWESIKEILRKILPEKSESLRTPIGKIDDLSPTDRECSLKNAEVVPKHICNGKQNCWVYHNLFHRDPCPEQVKYAFVDYKCEWGQYFWKNNI